MLAKSQNPPACTAAGNAPHAEAGVINSYEHLRLKSIMSAFATVDVIV